MLTRINALKCVTNTVIWLWDFGQCLKSCGERNPSQNWMWFLRRMTRFNSEDMTKNNNVLVKVGTQKGSVATIITRLMKLFHHVMRKDREVRYKRNDWGKRGWRKTKEQIFGQIMLSTGRKLWNNWSHPWNRRRGSLVQSTCKAHKRRRSKYEEIFALNICNKSKL